MSATGTASETYSTADVDNVFRWVGVDFKMIAESTGAITLAQAADYQADINLLAKEDCIASVDITLFSGSEEVKARKYTVNTSANGLANSRPGGVLWPRVSNPRLRIVVTWTPVWSKLKDSGKLKLRYTWPPNYEDLSHRTLVASGGRNYVSNAFGVVCQDYSK